MQPGVNKTPAKFGTLLGMAPGGVPIYSSDYDSADEREYPTRQSYQSYIDGVFMGYKWQCVEFARRSVQPEERPSFAQVDAMRKRQAA